MGNSSSASSSNNENSGNTRTSRFLGRRSPSRRIGTPSRFRSSRRNDQAVGNESGGSQHSEQGSQETHARCPRCNSTLVVPDGNPPFFRCPCGTTLRLSDAPDGGAAEGGAGAGERDRGRTAQDLRFEQMMAALGRRGQGTTGGGASAEGNGNSFFQRLAASDENGTSENRGDGRSQVSVIMCQHCGRIGMLPSDNPSAVFLCPCGQPVLAAAAAGAGGGDDDQISCRVCLSEYEDQEELKILPCFHKFHSSCIDEWLQRSSACPLCNNSVTRHNFGDEETT